MKIFIHGGLLLLGEVWLLLPLQEKPPFHKLAITVIFLMPRLRDGFIVSFAKFIRLVNLEKPVFLTGCGRSGTTILGQTLSHHPSITYLNEPRHIWHSSYPKTDIWSSQASYRNGSLYLTGSICTPRRNKKLRDLFYSEILLTGKPRLVEKLPENNFRLNFIHTVFPDALFLHIVRNGMEVARSIERACRESEGSGAEWFGTNGYKWDQLIKYAREIDKYQHLPELCQNNYDRGLLEWKLSVEAALDFFQSITYDKYLQITYEDLIENPIPILDQIEGFTSLKPSEEMYTFARAHIRRKSPNASGGDISENNKQIAGDLLERLGYLV